MYLLCDDQAFARPDSLNCGERIAVALSCTSDSSGFFGVRIEKYGDRLLDQSRHFFLMQIMSLPTSIIAYCTLIVAALLLGAYAYVKRESLGSQRIAISAPPHLAGTVRDGPVASAPALEIALISS